MAVDNCVLFVLVPAEFIYYTDWRREAIIRISRRGDQELAVREGMGRMMGIRIYDPSLQPLSSKRFKFSLFASVYVM